MVRPLARRSYRLMGGSAVLAALAGAAAAQPPVETAPMPHPAAQAVGPAFDLDRKVMAEVKTKSEIMANLGHLSDVIGPRLTGSAGLEKANRWTAEKMKEYGLANVRLEPWEIPVGWERGPATMTLNGRPLAIASRGWSPGTKGKVTGPVVVADIRTKADLAKYKGKLKNAVLLRGIPAKVAPITDMTYGPSAPKDGDKDKAKGPGERAKRKEQRKADLDPPAPPAKKDDVKKDTPPGSEGPPKQTFEELRAFVREVNDFYASEGVAAVVSDTGKPHGLLMTSGGWREGDRATPQEPLPGLFMAHENYALLYRLATNKGGPPPQVTLEVMNTFVPGPVTVFNTVGEITGKDKPDEVVVVGAHLDSWDLATGTTDNGTGSSVVLEVARTLAKLAAAGDRPSRTIRFVLFTGEEQGLYGSRRYCEKHEKELPKHSMALVHDTGTGRVVGFGLQGRADVQKVLEPELATLKELDGWRGLDLGSLNGTDHQSFERFNVPGFACRQDMDEYRLTHHTQSDTFDKAKEPNLVQGAQVIALTALRVANLPELLPRTKPAAKK